MRQRIILLFCCGLALAGCGSSEPKKKYEPDPSLLEQVPFFYRPDIQQGNIVTQEMVNKLETGMTPKQVRFLLGTPLLVDVFHNNEWHYLYTLDPASGEFEKQKLTIVFDRQGRLQEIRGDLQPQVTKEQVPQAREKVIDVPQDRTEEGWLDKTWKDIKTTWD
jgi:outer membrane protein assembly factor BamE